MTLESHFLKPAVVPEATLAELCDSSERAATIVAAAMLDDELRRQIQHSLLPIDNLDRDPLFDADEKPLQSFSVKINLAYRMAVIDESFAGFLHRLRRIRNEYAHQVPASGDNNFTMKRDGLANDFFYGIAEFDPETTRREFRSLDVDGSYATEVTALSRLMRSGASHQDIAFRLMLIAMIGFLGKPPFEVPGAVMVGICYTLANDEKGRTIVTAISLSYDHYT